jgi:hypothetical protein
MGFLSQQPWGMFRITWSLCCAVRTICLFIKQPLYILYCVVHHVLISDFRRIYLDWNFSYLIIAEVVVCVQVEALMIKYRVIHNSLTHLTESVHLHCGKDVNVRPTFTYMEREPTHVYLHALRALSFAGGLGHLCQHLPQHWIRRTTAEHQALLRWPPGSPGLMPCDFYLVEICWRLCLSTASTAEYAWAAKMNYCCHLRNRTWLAASGMDGNRLSSWRLPCHKVRTCTAIMGYAE